jgi:hypothetical protein
MRRSIKFQKKINKLLEKERRDDCNCSQEGAEMSLISASTKKVSPNYLRFWVYFKAQFETFQITTFSPSTLNTKESPFLIAIHVWTDVI